MTNSPAENNKSPRAGAGLGASVFLCRVRNLAHHHRSQMLDSRAGFQLAAAAVAAEFLLSIDLDPCIAEYDLTTAAAQPGRALLRRPRVRV